MKNEVENEEMIIKKIGFINEKSYQQFKKDMCKTNDYFTIGEWKKLGEKLT